MKDDRATTTLRILDAIDDTRVQDVMRERGVEPEGPIEDVQAKLDALPEDTLNDIYTGYMESVADDHSATVRQKIERSAQDLWRAVVADIEDRASYIKDTLIPKALDLHSRGKTEAFEDVAMQIDAASVELVTSVHQGRLEVREQLRRQAYAEAPYMPRADRFAIVNEVASAEDLGNTTLVAPAAAQETASQVAAFRREIARRDMEADVDYDMQIAAKRGHSPSPR
jgi:hypothetical protein